MTRTFVENCKELLQQRLSLSQQTNFTKIWNKVLNFRRVKNQEDIKKEIAEQAKTPKLVYYKTIFKKINFELRVKIKILITNLK